jgi:hypothetical protein
LHRLHQVLRPNGRSGWLVKSSSGFTLPHFPHWRVGTSGVSVIDFPFLLRRRLSSIEHYLCRYKGYSVLTLSQKIGHEKAALADG